MDVTEERLKQLCDGARLHVAEEEVPALLSQLNSLQREAELLFDGACTQALEQCGVQCGADCLQDGTVGRCNPCVVHTLQPNTLRPDKAVAFDESESIVRNAPGGKAFTVGRIIP